jgi:hypothetical protein
MSKNPVDTMQGNFVFLLLFLVYFGSNVVYYFSAILEGVLIVDGVEFNVNENLSWSLGLTLILLLMQYFAVNKFKAINTKKEIYVKFYSHLLYFSLAYQFAFYLYNYVYGYGVAGQSISQDSVFKYLFYVISPDLMAVIVSVLVRKSKLYYLNLFFLAFSLLSRGWAGGIMMVVFILLINSNYSSIKDILKKSGFKIFFFLIFVLVMLPVLNAFKFWIRDDGGESFTYFIEYILGDNGFFSVIENSILYLLSRFSITGSVNLIFDNKEILRDAYASQQIVPFWSENTLVSSFYRMLTDRGVSASNFIVTEILGYSDVTWNSHVGLPGWLIILPAANAALFLFYYMTLLLTGLFLSRVLGGRVFSMVSVFSLSFLYNGWFSSYILVIYCLLFVIVLRFIFFRPKGTLIA